MAALGHKVDSHLLAHWKADSADRTDTKFTIKNLGSLSSYNAVAEGAESTCAQVRPLGPTISGFRKFARIWTPGTSSVLVASSNTTLESALKSTYTAEAFVRVFSLASAQSMCAYTASGETLATNTLFQWIITTAGRMQVFTENGAGVNQTISQSSGAQMVTGTWYYIAVTQDATNVNFYINGNLEQSVAKGTLATGGTSGNFYLGSNQDLANATSPFNGCMANFKITAGAKSGAAIAAAYAQYVADFELTTDSALIHYKMTDRADTIYDSLDKIHIWPTTTLSFLHRSGSLIDDDGGGFYNNASQTFGYAADNTTPGSDAVNVELLRQAFIGSTGWTFSGWFKIATTTVGDRINGLFCFGDPGVDTEAQNFCSAEIAANGAITFFSEHGAGVNDPATTTYTLGSLYKKRNHIAIRRNAVSAGKHTVDVFVNGVLVETLTNITTYTGGTTASLRLLSGSSEVAFIGSADDICFADVPRTDAEILENYRRGVRLVPPVISGVTAAGAIGNGATVQFDVTHATESEVASIARIQAWVERADGIAEMVHDGTSSGFKSGYTGASTNTGITNGRRIVIERDNDWDTTGFTLVIRATDIHGNVATSSTAYTTDYVVPPVDAGPPEISLVTPADGAALTKYQPITFRLTDDFQLRAAFIWIKYANIRQKIVVYDGEEFSDPFDVHSTVTPTGDTQLDFSILPAGGWLDAIEELRVRFLDAAGNLDEE